MKWGNFMVYRRDRSLGQGAPPRRRRSLTATVFPPYRGRVTVSASLTVSAASIRATRACGGFERFLYANELRRNTSAVATDFSTYLKVTGFHLPRGRLDWTSRINAAAVSIAAKKASALPTDFLNSRSAARSLRVARTSARSLRFFRALMPAAPESRLRVRRRPRVAR